MKAKFLFNGHHIGLVMREACKRAMNHALDRCFEVEAEVKGAKADGRPDWVTPADRECEVLVISLLREHFPDFGIISEESDLAIACTIPDELIYFTVDPIDGTSAYKRHQSAGWGCMISLVHGSDVIAVCVGDANSGEMYYYRPGSDKTHRLLRRGEHTKDVLLGGGYNRPLSEQYLQLRSLPRRHSSLVQEIIDGDLFMDAETANGSIGLSEARRWKSEVGGTILRQSVVTPWDDTPIIGMDRRLGFLTFMLDAGEGSISKWERLPPLSKATATAEREMLIIHASRIPDLAAWCQRRSITFQND
ncbi:hypothetical protein HQ487_02260 [Candidatus Uhrbacteria bacterium]|nr:hypothetical protein [Candidatus Uhrbacteria bacterium]